MTGTIKFLPFKTIKFAYLYRSMTVTGRLFSGLEVVTRKLPVGRSKMGRNRPSRVRANKVLFVVKNPGMSGESKSRYTQNQPEISL